MTFALLLAGAAAHAEEHTAAGPCDELVTYLREALTGEPPWESSEYGNQDWEQSLEEQLRSDRDTAPPAYVARVTPACRAAIQRGDARVAVAAARAWTQTAHAGWIEAGRTMLCAMQDPGSLAEVPAWMEDAHRFGEARAICVSALATWPGAEAQRTMVGLRVVRARGDWLTRWEIDPAVVAVANALGTPELRESLVPVLEVAAERRARGYDKLQDAVCMKDEQVSRARARACATLPLEAEHDWWQGDQWKRHLATGALTATFASLAAAAFADGDAGRAIATGSGAVFGAVCGAAVGWGVSAPGVNAAPRNSEPLRRQAAVAGGALVGAVAGGVFAHSYSTSPSKSGGTTVLTLSPLYLGAVLAVHFD